MIRVRIREDLIDSGLFVPTFFSPEMRKYFGMEAEIKDCGLDGSFRLNIPGGESWIWYFEMVEVLELPEGYYSININNLIPIPVRLDDKKIVPEMDFRIGGVYPGIPKKVKLRRELYGIGKTDEEIDVVEINSHIYLDSKYLPMCGELRKCEYELT